MLRGLFFCVIFKSRKIYVSSGGVKMKPEQSLSKIIEMLEQAFDILNKQYFENTLSKSVITIQSTPKAYGHFSSEKIWDISEENKAYEINLGAETLNREIEEVIATLIHEMVHQYCSENDIKDTSRGNTYHNGRFKFEAEKRDLIIERAEKIGWSVTTPSKALKKYISTVNTFKQIGLCRHTFVKEEGKKTSSTRKYVCPCCEQSVRATKQVHIKCSICELEMIVTA